MEHEYTANTAIRERSFDGTVTLVLGGTKAEDSIPVIEQVDETADQFCLGGVIGELFLRADGHEVGYDIEGTKLFDHQWEAHQETIERVLEEDGDRLHLPRDLAYDDNGERAETPVEGITKETSYFDIGSETAGRYADLVTESEAVFVKGALGVFEDKRFADGTIEVLSAIADTECFSVVGGEIQPTRSNCTDLTRTTSRVSRSLEGHMSVHLLVIHSSASKYSNGLILHDKYHNIQLSSRIFCLFIHVHLRSIFVILTHSNSQHRHISHSYDSLGHASKEVSGESAPSMGAHHDQIDVGFVDVLHDRLVRNSYSNDLNHVHVALPCKFADVADGPLRFVFEPFDRRFEIGPVPEVADFQQFGSVDHVQGMYGRIVLLCDIETVDDRSLGPLLPSVGMRMVSYIVSLLAHRVQRVRKV